MIAMILSAGFGKRMRPLTDHTPKPLLEVGGKPLIVWHIERLKEAGFSDIVVNIAYLGYKIVDYLGDGSKYGVNIEYSDEQREGGLETAGGIIKALPLLGETFLVVNGDIWTDYRYDIKYRLPQNMLGKIVLIDNPPHNPEGDFPLNGGKKRFTFAGIGYYSQELFKGIEYGRRRLAPILHQALKVEEIVTEYYSGEWYDIGTPLRLKELNVKLLNTI